VWDDNGASRTRGARSTGARAAAADAMTSEKHTVTARDHEPSQHRDAPLRLVVVDTTDTALPWQKRRRGAPSPGGALGPLPDAAAGGEARRGGVGLSPIWRAGAFAYEATRTADASLAADSWGEALVWAVGVADRSRRAIGSLQVWCHGGWGSVRLGASRLDSDALAPGHALAAEIDALRDHLAQRDALVWFRCCSAFGHHGRHFAAAAADRLRCRVAGHTHIIHFFQSGLHSLAPGQQPGWDPAEGVRFARGRAAGARSSSPMAPSTITCLRTTLPDGV
jgi:hypothetical protein